MFTQEELTALMQLMGRVQIQGNEAMAVAMLQQKIQGMLAPKEEPKEEKK